MKIGVLVDPYGEVHPSGLGRWAQEIVRNLLALDTGDTYTLYVKHQDPASPSPFGSRAQLRPLQKKTLWFSGGHRLDSRQDLYLFLNPLMPLTFFPKRAVVVAHDFAYLEIKSHGMMPLIRAYSLYFLQLITFWKARKILCISEETRQAVQRHFRIPKDKTNVITLGPVELGTRTESVNVPRDFFLFAGVLKERKNVKGIIRAFAIFCKENPEFSSHELCIAGRTGGEYYDQLVKLADELGVRDRIRFLGYVTDGQILFLYQNAAALVFPSFIEGFGMPVLEAMQSGLPVITSDRGALAEVAGDAALLVDPADPAAIGAALTRIAREPQLREQLREAGYCRAAEFSWEKTAQQVQHAINSL